MRDAVKQALTGNITPEDINEQYISEHLETNFMSDPDLLIRTGVELRISNYLLWQCAYSEFYFTDEFWPDFTEESLRKAIADYQQRQRRYGKTGDQVSDEE
jgi:undecaprenyl diphosphate synthase